MDRERKFRGLWGMEVSGDGRRKGIGGRSREQGLAKKPKMGRKGGKGVTGEGDGGEGRR